MLKPKNPNGESPAGGWTYVDEISGVTFNSAHLKVVQQRAYKHWIANNNPVTGDFEAMVHDNVCRNTPSCACIDTEKSERTYGPDDVKRFLTVAQEMLGGYERVSVEEQERRVQVCLKCPAMGQINCKWCGWVSGAVESLLGRRSFPSKREAHKMSCLRCGCNIPSKTALPLELLRKVDEEMEKVSGKVEYAEGCWMLESTPTQNRTGTA